MNDDKFGDIQKGYEEKETFRRFSPELPVLARIDGKCFHSYTKGMDRPFDMELIKTFQETTQRLVQETNATVGYQQSDEISLAWTNGNIFFEGKAFKMLSVIASMTTAFFSEAIRRNRPYTTKTALFDCRVWEVPNIERALEYFLWREADAVKNSISMVAQTKFSTNELLGKHSKERQEMLFGVGVNWNDYPDECKRGTYYGRKTSFRTFTTEELDNLPPLHQARLNPSLVYERTDVERLVMDRLSRVANATRMLFNPSTHVAVYLNDEGDDNEGC